MSIKFFKKIEPTQSVYHHMKIDESVYALYDDKMDNPVAYGSKNLVQMKLNSVLQKTTSSELILMYYKRSSESNHPFKVFETKTFKIVRDINNKIVSVKEK